MVAEPLPVTDTGDGMDALFEDGVILQVGFHWWRGQKKLQAEDLGLAEEDVPEIFSLGRKLLVPRTSLIVFKRIESKVQAQIDTMSFPHPVGAGRFVPAAAIGQVLDKVGAGRKEFDREAKAFLRRYERHQRDMLSQYPQYARALEGVYPPKDELARKFRVEVFMYEMRFPRGVQARALTVRQARAKGRKAKLEAAAQQRAMAEYQADLRARMSNWLEDVAGAMRQETVRVCENLARGVEQGKLSPAQVQGLHLWIERFGALNFMDDAEMSRALNRLKGQFNQSVKEINSNPAALAAIGKAVKRTVKAASAAGKPKVIANTYRRRVRFEE